MYIWYVYSIIQEVLQKVSNNKNLQLEGVEINNRSELFARIYLKRALIFLNVLKYLNETLYTYSSYYY